MTKNFFVLMPFFRKRKPPITIIEVAKAKMRAIDILTRKLPIGSTIPMSRVQKVAKRLGSDPEEIAQKLTVLEGHNVYRD